MAWCRAVGEALNAQQLAAHDAVKHAHHQIKMTAAPATGGNAWALLPRDVRHALRDAVQQGDAVRRAVADLQAVLVRRFLRLCASKDGHEEPDSALKDALRVVRGAASREVVRRKALCAALHDAQYKAAEGVLKRIRDRPPSASVARDLFRLRKNRFDALRLRTPAAKARFAAATARAGVQNFTKPSRHRRERRVNAVDAGEVEFGRVPPVAETTRAAVQRRPRAGLPGGWGVFFRARRLLRLRGRGTSAASMAFQFRVCARPRHPS